MTEHTVTVEAPIAFHQEDGTTILALQPLETHPTTTPGLVVGPLLTGFLEVDEVGCTVTHVGSGKRLPYTFPAREAAADCAAALSHIDWTANPMRLDAATRAEIRDTAVRHGGLTDDQWRTAS